MLADSPVWGDLEACMTYDRQEWSYKARASTSFYKTSNYFLPR